MLFRSYCAKMTPILSDTPVMGISAAQKAVMICFGLLSAMALEERALGKSCSLIPKKEYAVAAERKYMLKHPQKILITARDSFIVNAAIR